MAFEASAIVNQALLGDPNRLEALELRAWLRGKLGDPLVLIAHLVEGVPLVSEAGQRPLRRPDPVRVGGEVHESVVFGEPVPVSARDLDDTIGDRGPAPRAPHALHDQLGYCLPVVVEHTPTPVLPPRSSDPSL